MTKNGEYLQVFMAHESVIERFRRFVEVNGWDLAVIPRMDESDETYVKTHIIVPKRVNWDRNHD